MSDEETETPGGTTGSSTDVGANGGEQPESTAPADVVDTTVEGSTVISSTATAEAADDGDENVSNDEVVATTAAP